MLARPVSPAATAGPGDAASPITSAAIGPAHARRSRTVGAGIRSAGVTAGGRLGLATRMLPLVAGMHVALPGVVRRSPSAPPAEGYVAANGAVPSGEWPAPAGPSQRGSGHARHVRLVWPAAGRRAGRRGRARPPVPGLAALAGQALTTWTVRPRSRDAAIRACDIVEMTPNRAGTAPGGDARRGRGNRAYDHRRHCYHAMLTTRTALGPRGERGDARRRVVSDLTTGMHPATGSIPGGRRSGAGRGDQGRRVVPPHPRSSGGASRRSPGRVATVPPSSSTRRSAPRPRDRRPARGRRPAPDRIALAHLDRNPTRSSTPSSPPGE